MGMMWFLRSASFNLGLGGGVATGFPASRTFSPGNAYSLDEDELPAVRDLYEALRRYESTPDEEVPVNLNLALRSFSDIYERRNLYRTDTQLVDAITATEALLGTDVEVAFRLAFRVAMILGGDDDERVRIFERMRGYYNTRSSVVHGGSRLYNKSGQLKDKPRRHLDDQQDLRNFVRRLLIVFLRLTNSSGHSYDKEFFDNRLDNALLHGAQRSALRVAMGLEKNNTSS
jgi:hypothetical protein